MAVLPRLVELYSKRGYEIATGLFPPTFGNFGEAAFTWLLHKGRPTTGNLGIALQEVYFLECLLAEWQPRRILVIGNSFGWSTLALALICPQARVVALDACFTPDTNAGLVLTNLIAAEERLNATAVRGVSPQDVEPVVRARLEGGIDLALIDGNHTNEAVVADFRAIRPFLAPDHLTLFHDVQAFRLFDGLKTIVEESGLAGQLLLGTPSGMVALADPARRLPGVQAALEAFAPSSEAVKALASERERRQAAAARRRAAETQAAAAR